MVEVGTSRLERTVRSGERQEQEEGLFFVLLDEADRGVDGATNQVQGAPDSSACMGRIRSPFTITMEHPAPMAMRPAATLVTMPPEE